MSVPPVKASGHIVFGRWESGLTYLCPTRIALNHDNPFAIALRISFNPVGRLALLFIGEKPPIRAAVPSCNASAQ